MIQILNNCIQEDVTDQRLIAATTRGGLKAVKLEMQQIFTIAEETFRVHTSVANHVSKINIDYMVSQLRMETRIVSLYNNLVVDADVGLNSEVKKNLLENILKLYLRVRAFSYTKDITNQHKCKLKKTKAKALRKNIKKSTEKPDIVE